LYCVSAGSYVTMIICSLYANWVSEFDKGMSLKCLLKSIQHEAMVKYYGIIKVKCYPCMQSWEGWNGAASNNRIHRGFRLIWHALVWSLWRARNDRIFNNSTCEVDEIAVLIFLLVCIWQSQFYCFWCWSVCVLLLLAL
jgi:hypothetical protein